MRKKIIDYLHQLELERDITILWACETGSRAWGFPSTNSDYDIRLIYVHKKDWYVSLSERKDSIELMFENNDIDITGWELKKALKLLRKSNASMIERVQSPIIYKSDDAFHSEILLQAQQHYSKIATMHHYLSMSKGFIYNLDTQYKLKKFFYTLRSAMVCKWILEKDEMPPIEFEKVYLNLDLDPSIINRIQELIILKREVSEDYLHEGEEALMTCIQSWISEADALKNNLPGVKNDISVLDNLFRKYVNKYDH